MFEQSRDGPDDRRSEAEELAAKLGIRLYDRKP
jgi:hypothetical protein